MSSNGGGGLPGLDAIQTWIHKAHEKGGSTFSIRLLSTVFLTELIAFFIVAPAQTAHNFQMVLFFAPLWMPLVLYHFALIRFMDANKVAWIKTQKHVLLEIKLPRDTRRTPLSMETVFSSMHLGGGENTWYKRIIEGRARPWYSYEIVSIGGQVHFYAWMREGWRRAFESYIYSQYPGVEVIEAMDYSRLVDPSHAPYMMTAFEYKKLQPDPYPIKTYIDFGLDRVQKPEEQTDPLANVLEAMGAIGPNEQIWLQFIVRIHAGEKYKAKWIKGKPFTWKDEAREEIQAIRDAAIIETEQVDSEGNVKKVRSGINPTEGQKDRIKAIERNIGKQAYDVGIRSIYMAPEGSPHGTTGGVLANIFKPFGSEQYNSIMPAPRFSDHYFDYPWEDKDGHHYAHDMHIALEMYRRRAFYHAPYVGEHHVFSTEELATLYHIPSSSVTTPSLPRIQSTTAEAPVNLPI